jgi:galactose mutarotase-like enzyme
MDFVELQSGASHACISLQGGECLRWSCADVELLWEADAAIWDRTAPLLFPVCGWTRGGQVRLEGQTYQLGLHGFAARERFVVVEQDTNQITLRLTDTAETRALYPFAFVLDVTYSLEANALEIRARVTNSGGEPMPYAFGLHPGFHWLGSPDECRLLFDEAERAEVPVIAPGGLFSDETRPVHMNGRTLPLGEDLFAREALCFLNARSRGLTFGGPKGRLRVETQNFPHWVIWSKPDAPFLCLESWTGHGDPVGFGGDLFQKPGMITLPPGASGQHQARYMFTA